MRTMEITHRRSRYILIWVAVGVLLGTFLLVSEYSRNPLNDPDQAQQRPGFLLPPSAFKTPQIIPGVPRDGHRVVIFFARSLKGQALFHDLADQADVTNAADVVVVTQDGSRPTIEGGIRHFAFDPNGTVVAAFGLNQPIDGGAPIGYILIDSDGFIRYRTLDPNFRHLAKELKIMLGATP